MADGLGSVLVSFEDKQLLSSGSFLTFGRGETKLLVRLGSDSIVVIFQFVDSEKGETPRLESQIVDPQTLRLIFHDFKSALGSFTTVPLEVGTIANRKLWYLFKISGLQRSESKHVVYSFYVGPEVTDGQA